MNFSKLDYKLLFNFQVKEIQYKIILRLGGLAIQQLYLGLSILIQNKKIAHILNNNTKNYIYFMRFVYIQFCFF